MSNMSISPREKKKIDKQKMSGVTKKDWLYEEPKKEFSLDDYVIPEEEAPERIGGIVPKGKVMLAFGPPGSGKSTTVMKILNGAGITPAYLSLDDGGLNAKDGFEFINIGHSAIESIFDGNADDALRGMVLVIDTYTRLIHNKFFAGKSDADIVSMFEELCLEAELTIIVIGHAAAYASATYVFNDNDELLRSAYEVLMFDLKINAKGVAVYSCLIKKGRNGIGAGSLSTYLTGQEAIKTANTIMKEAK